MSGFNFNGAIETIGQPQLEFIGKVLHERGYKGPDVAIEQVGNAADNYGANVKRVVITENGKTFKMIAKLAPSIPMMREIGNLELVFSNEHIVYTKLLPKFRQLQRSAGVPVEELFRFAECYGSNGEAPNEVILLEDLKEDNFVMLDKFKPLSNDSVKLVLKNFAVLHSLSHVLKREDPELFDELKSKFRDMMTGPMAEREEFQAFFSQMEANALSIIHDEKYTKFIKGTVKHLVKYAKEFIKYDADSSYSVIQQGDGWTNNILFQIKNGSTKRCVLIDYQLARGGNPAYDIMYMLFNSTNHEQRQRHYYEFIDHYHSEMGKSLKIYGIDIDTVYPREQLDLDLKRYAKFMLAVSVMLCTFTIRSNDDAVRFKDSMENTTTEIITADPEKAMEAMFITDADTRAIYKSRVEGVIDSYLEFGLLQQEDDLAK